MSTALSDCLGLESRVLSHAVTQVIPLLAAGQRRLSKSLVHRSSFSHHTPWFVDFLFRAIPITVLGRGERVGRFFLFFPSFSVILLNEER